MLMPTHGEIKAAGGNDVGDWGEKDLIGAYPPGTTFDINGEKVGVDELPDLIGTSVDTRDLAAAGDHGTVGGRSS
jgi:hypothetical protein